MADRKRRGDDAAPMYSVRWNDGVHNWMTYIAADVPMGAYNSKRLANLGTGHCAVDSGAGYTYFNPQTGHEFSAVLGFTYNFKNPATQYQNGVDMHLDWGASQFLTKQWQVGLVGYVYQQLSCDSGSGDRVGCFERLGWCGRYRRGLGEFLFFVHIRHFVATLSPFANAHSTALATR